MLYRGNCIWFTNFQLPAAIGTLIQYSSYLMEALLPHKQQADNVKLINSQDHIGTMI